VKGKDGVGSGIAESSLLDKILARGNDLLARLKLGKAAIGLEVLDRLEEVRGK